MATACRINVQSVNPLVERTPFATVFRRQRGSRIGGPSWGALSAVRHVDGDDGPFAGSACSRSLWLLRWTPTRQPHSHSSELEVGVSIRPDGERCGLRLRADHAALSGSSDRTAFTRLGLTVRAALDTPSDRSDRRGGNGARGSQSMVTIAGTLGLDDAHKATAYPRASLVSTADAGSATARMR